MALCVHVRRHVRDASQGVPQRDVVVVDHHPLLEALVRPVLRVDLGQQRFDFHDVVDRGEREHSQHALLVHRHRGGAAAERGVDGGGGGSGEDVGVE